MPIFAALGPPRALEVLVLADERGQARIAAALAPGMHRVTVVGEVYALLWQIWQQLPDVIIVAEAPSVGAIPELCRQLRAFLQTPILVIEEGASEGERICWLDSGADDVLTLQRPESAELSARCAALLRRVQRQLRRDPGALLLQAHGLQLDIARRRLHAPGGQAIDVSPSQLCLLALLFSRDGELLLNQELIGHLVGPAAPEDAQAHLERLVAGLNRRFTSLRPRPFIERVHRQGYRLALRDISAAG